MNRFFKLLNDYIETNNYLFFAILSIIFGILILIFTSKLLSSFINIVLLVMLFSCLKTLFRLVTQKQDKVLLIPSLISAILIFISLGFINIHAAIVIMIFAFFFTIEGICKIIIYFIYKKYNEPHRLAFLIEGISLFTLGIVSFFAPNMHMMNVLRIVGFYLILLGIENFFDFLDIKNIHIKHIRIPLPPMIDALVPYTILQRLNMEEQEVDNKNTNLEIIIHVSKQGAGPFGHVDICYKDKVLSYGNFDSKTRKLFLVFGSGVLFFAEKKEYFKFCINESNKTLFTFGIELTKEEEEKLEEYIVKLKENLIIFETDYIKKKKEQKKVDDTLYNDYVSSLYKACHPEFYKFKNGKMKSYFAAGSNCANFIDHIIRYLKIESLYARGIITPGTYYSFLEREYIKKGSRVVSKKIYTKENVDKL